MRRYGEDAKDDVGTGDEGWLSFQGISGHFLDPAFSQIPREMPHQTRIWGVIPTLHTSPPKRVCPGQEGSRALDAYGFLLAHAELENEELSFWGNVRGAAQLAFLRQGGSVHVSPSAFFEKNTLRPSSAVRTVRGPVVVVAEPSHDPSHRERFLRGS